MRPLRILDLYSGAGGAGLGYQQAGFDIFGVDLAPQPRYPGVFIQADVLNITPRFIRSFDAVHASPPCQKHTAMKTMHNAREHADLIPPTISVLKEAGVPWIIENVEGAPLTGSITLCGTMFGLGSGDMQLRRHRKFIASFPIAAPCACDHHGPSLGLYGGHIRDRRRRAGSHARGLTDPPLAAGREAMGISHMSLMEMCQAIPPAYTKYLGERLVEHIASAREAACR